MSPIVIYIHHLQKYKAKLIQNIFVQRHDHISATLGNCNRFAPVFAVERKPERFSANSILGFIMNPSKGSL